VPARKLPRNRFIWLAAGVAALVLLVAVAWALRAGVPTVPFSAFLQDVQADRVRAITVDGDTFRVERRDGTTVETVAPQGYAGANPAFVPGLVDRGVRFDVSRAAALDASGYSALALTLLGGALVGLVVSRVRVLRGHGWTSTTSPQ
jgi:hypothetical protein